MSVTWTGLDELGRMLRALPDDLQRESARIVETTAREHHAAVSARFPENSVTGNLKRGNTLVQTGPLTWRTRNKAPHSHLYEKGYQHVSGKRVAGHDVWVPEAETLRARMVESLRAVLTRVATRTGTLSGQA
jgi:hypothetical protein